MNEKEVVKWVVGGLVAMTTILSLGQCSAIAVKEKTRGATNIECLKLMGEMAKMNKPIKICTYDDN